MSSDIDEGDANRGRAQAMLILAEDYLPPGRAIYLQEFLDHNESGLALDWILTALLERGQPVPIGISAELESMKDLIDSDGDPEERLARLRTLAEQPPGTRDRVRAILGWGEDYLPTEQAVQLREFIDKGEWGMALDWMLTAFLERGESVPAAFAAELASMGYLLYPGEDAQGRLDQLRGLVQDQES